MMSEILGLSNIYIDSILKSCKTYLGIYSSDNIPKTLKNSLGCIVVNLSPEGTIGSHFITIILERKQVLYIDSLGRECQISTIQDFLKCTDRVVFYQSRAMQLPFSPYCGFYCMLVVTNYEIYYEWTNPFKEEMKNNDSQCIILLCKNVRKIRNKEVDP